MQIVNEAKETGADMIIMGSHGPVGALGIHPAKHDDKSGATGALPRPRHPTIRTRICDGAGVGRWADR